MSAYCDMTLNDEMQTNLADCYINGQ